MLQYSITVVVFEKKKVKYRHIIQIMRIFFLLLFIALLSYRIAINYRRSIVNLK